MKANSALKFFLAISLIVFFACEIEPYAESQAEAEQLTPVEEFQLHFDLTEFDDPTGHIVKNIKVDWANYKTEKFDDK